MADERIAVSVPPTSGARARRLRQQALRACGRAAELAKSASMACGAAAALRIEAQHVRHVTRTVLEGTATVAAPDADLDWLRPHRERMASGPAPPARPEAPARSGSPSPQAGTPSA